MSEECTHDCSNCGAACSSRNAAPQHDAPNPHSRVKKVIGVVGGSIGEKLYEARIYLQTGDLLAWTAVIVALSALFERAVLALLRRCCRWAKGGRT